MDIVYFTLNNWIAGDHYPDAEPFKSWLSDDGNQYFMNDDWCKENELCVYCGFIDQSFNYTISAKKEWVEKNCPELLTKYSVFVISTGPNKDIPDYDYWYQPFRKYCEENFGCEFYDE